ncbi:nuclear pore complex protein Nup153 isoform X2 [Solenopsis invicta]|uniref:nuclear pore complex protein Nup153 isoform X2 n=1 Tax=Solenopsis invicta TaxID=13686 RepID=UPI000595FEE4|nr:nuclear pore complex protein Nup153 isoform X2 [Solenopsis invicta]
MPREGGNPAGRRPSSRNAKPYDVNNSFVRKVATKVTDFIPQSSWISKWFNTSQGNEDALDGTENIVETELEDDAQQPPPSKRARIRMDVIHPPGTFSIQSRVKTALNTVEPSKGQYPVNNDMTEDFLEPATAGPSGISRLISSTPAVQTDIRTVTSHRSDLNSLTSSTNNGIANGMDDNSESSESTSGCSSLIPQINRHEGSSNLLYSSTFTSRKRHVDDKLTFTNHLQSPRSLFLDSNSRDTLSSRRPSFNASIVTNAADRASPLSSPFYSGNITFGGANAAGLYKRSQNIFNTSNDIQLKVPRRTNVEVKPSDGVDSSGMSQTAKKILEALEHFSSPVSDAKKIPLKNTSMSSATTKKRAREEIVNPSARIGLRHLTRELTVPTVPDILKLRRRQKLQDTTLMARKIVSARSDPPPPPQEYRLRREDTDNEKYRGKLKGKSKINLEQEETVAPVNLPNIPLPITTLPNFNFTLSPPASHSAGKTVANKENTFTFASPIKVTDAGRSLQSVNNFTFSNPIDAEVCTNTNATNSNLPSTTENEFTVDCAITSVPNFIWSGSSTAPRLKAKVKNSKDDSVGSAMSQELKSGNIIDAFSSKSNKMESNFIGQPNSGLTFETTDKTTSTFAGSDFDITRTQGMESWECSECMIRNSGADKQCTACKISRPDPNEKTSSPTTDTIVETKPIAQDCFGSQFKLSSNQWECATCSVRNKQNDTTCVACTAPKPGNSFTMQQPVKSQNFNLMEKFKPTEGSWECSGCLLSNAANVITCPCCNTSKPIIVKTKPKTDNVTELSVQKLDTSTEVRTTQEISNNSEIMNKFKPSKDSWECPGCLVRNNNSVTSCPCCSTPKPNSTGEPSKAEQTSSNGFGDKFKKPEGAWTCDTCMLQNDSKNMECVACQALKPGTVKSNESSSNTSSTLQFKFGVPQTCTTNSSGPHGFKFGIDKTDSQSKSDATSPLNGFKFGSAQQNSGMAQFTFGIPKEQNKAVSEEFKTVTTSSSSTGFLFNMKNPEKPEYTNQNQETKQEILFGMPKNDNLITASEKQNINVVSSAPPTAPSTVLSTVSSFTFGVQKPGFNQSDSNKEVQKTSFVTTVTESSKPVVTTDTVPISTNTTLPSLLTQKDTTTNISDAKPKPIFSFGVQSSISTVTTTSTNATTTCLPTFAQPTFTFSNSKTSSQPTTIPSFGQIPTSSASLSTNVSFAGNKVTETTPSTNKTVNDTSAAIPLFPSATPLFNNESKVITFGTYKPSFTATGDKPLGYATPENKVPTFGSNTENKPSIFGTPETKLPAFNSPAANPLSTFGTPSNNATSIPFGSANAPAFGSNTTSAFGGTTTTPTIFSTTKPSETTVANPSLFTFGSTSSQQSASGGFNFSANINPATSSSAKSLFTFGNNSSTPQSNNNTFGSGTFGANSASTNTANFTFNPPKQETPAAFGQGAVATPMFGTPQATPQTQATSSFSSTPSSSTGFNFGSAAPGATPSGGFNFGGMPSTSASTGGFNFNSASTPAVAFDPNSRPSFNFTKGSAPTAFNAPPQSATAPPRKIKKAFRRCAR